MSEPLFWFDKVARLRPATLLQERLSHRSFPGNFSKFLSTHFHKTPVAVSGTWFYETSLYTYIHVYLYPHILKFQLKITQTQTRISSAKGWVKFSGKRFHMKKQGAIHHARKYCQRSLVLDLIFCDSSIELVFGLSIKDWKRLNEIFPFLFQKSSADKFKKSLSSVKNISLWWTCRPLKSRMLVNVLDSYSATIEKGVKYIQS